MNRLSAKRRPLLTALRLLVLVASLLNFAIASAGHDHDRARQGGDSLCAICVHGNAGGAAVSTHGAPEAPLVANVEPAFRFTAKVASRARGNSAIRGPPLAS